MRTIQVNGYASLSVPPDAVEVKITLQTRSKDYTTAVKTNAKALSALKNSLYGAGACEGELKTSEYSVNTRYDSVRQPDAEYKNVFIGYGVVTSLKLDFSYDMDKLNRIISAITASGAECEYNIRFYVKERGALRDKLIALAVEDARSKAAVLADAAGVELLGIESVTHDQLSANAYSSTDYRPRMLSAVNESVSIDPESVLLNDKVHITWEIK